jgi:hypothetical protein
MNENAFLQAKVATPLFETRVTHSQFITEKREYGKTASINSNSPCLQRTAKLSPAFATFVARTSPTRKTRHQSTIS